MTHDLSPVGRVLRSSTTEFVVGCQDLARVPTFGSFVKVKAHDGIWVYGAAYNVLIDDDPFVRQIIGNPHIPREVALDQKENRQTPIEVKVLVLGYARDGLVYQYLPPQPPATLSDVYPCTASEVTAFTDQLSYLRTILFTPQIPADELLAANLREAYLRRGGDREFLVEAGREAARLLKDEYDRLKAILSRIRPSLFRSSTPEPARRRGVT
ncbi:MAG: hypothetical protein AB1566_03200 [Chloroflexota bacterium]